MGKKWKSVRPTPYFKRDTSQIWRGTPILGMDNEDLLEEVGYSAEEIAHLKEEKIIVAHTGPKKAPDEQQKSV